jgi:hypothetical protein
MVAASPGDEHRAAELCGVPRHAGKPPAAGRSASGGALDPVSGNRAL